MTRPRGRAAERASISGLAGLRHIAPASTAAMVRYWFLSHVAQRRHLIAPSLADPVGVDLTWPGSQGRSGAPFAT